MRSTTLRHLSLAAAFACALTACSDSTSPRSATLRPVTLSLATGGSNTIAASRTITIGSEIGASSGGALVITRAQLVLRDVKLESATTVSGCTDDSNDNSASFSRASFSNGADDGANHDANDDHGTDENEGCGEMKLGPVLVDLPIGAGATQAISVQIPEGSYREIKLKLHKPDANGDARDAAFLAAHPDFSGVSVRVEGTYDGTPFTYVSDVSAQYGLEFGTPFQVAAGGANITLQVNVAGWFTNGSGQAIDPSTAGHGGTNEQLVEDHIRSSFRAVEDDDRNGEDDHHGGDDQGGDA